MEKPKWERLWDQIINSPKATIIRAKKIQEINNYSLHISLNTKMEAFIYYFLISLVFIFTWKILLQINPIEKAQNTFHRVLQHSPSLATSTTWRREEKNRRYNQVNYSTHSMDWKLNFILFFSIIWSLTQITRIILRGLVQPLKKIYLNCYVGLGYFSIHSFHTQHLLDLVCERKMVGVCRSRSEGKSQVHYLICRLCF